MDESDMERTLEEQIYDFGQKFDYGEFHDDPRFWVEALAHQADEAREALDEGDEPHAYREAADAVLIAFNFMRSCGDAAPRHYILERITNAEERGIEDEIVPKYKNWYRVNHVNKSYIYQYCTHSGCYWVQMWEGGSAANDPAIDHLKSNSNHTVRSGVNDEHKQKFEAQASGEDIHVQ